MTYKPFVLVVVLPDTMGSACPDVSVIINNDAADLLAFESFGMWEQFCLVRLTVIKVKSVVGSDDDVSRVVLAQIVSL